MLTYLVKQKKKTACLPGSETFVVTKNGRNAMKCVCTECGITKFTFVKGKYGEGIGDILSTFTGSLIKSGTDQFQKVYNTAPQYQLYSLFDSGQHGEGILSLLVKWQLRVLLRLHPMLQKQLSTLPGKFHLIFREIRNYNKKQLIMLSKKVDL